MATLTPTTVLRPQLTTTFTPPSGCLDLVYTLSPGGDDIRSKTSIKKYTYPVAIRGFTSSCYPPDYQTLINQANLGQVSCYSPGICPVGYVTKGTQSSPAGHVTTNICCPSNFYVGVPSPGQPGFAVNCTMLPLIHTSVTFINGTNRGSFDLVYQVVPPILIANAPTDTAAQATPASTTPATSKQTLAAPTPPPTAFSTNSSLSTGAEAGIGVGVAVCAIALAALGIYFYFRRRARRKRQDPSGEGSANAWQDKPELPGETREKIGGIQMNQSGGMQMNEMGGTEVNEMGGKETHELLADGSAHETHDPSGTGKPIELNDANTRAELDGGWSGNERPLLEND